MNEPGNPEDAFVQRIAAKLRRPERADESFAERVLSAVRVPAPGVDIHAKKRGFWLRPRTIRITPLATLAMAAGILLAVAGITTLAQRRPAAPVAEAASSDTVHMVRFVFADSAARDVMLVGTFNDWTKGATPLVRQGAGIWTISVELPSGRHEYAFVVRDSEGERWMVDPYAVSMRYEFGTENSVVSVGGST